MKNKLPRTIEQTHKGLLKGEFTAMDLVDSYLARIKKYDGELNSFITITDDIAFKGAKKADKLISQMGKGAFEKYPLLGCVVAYKDLYLTKGTRTTAASKVLESYIPAYSAKVVERLNKAGAVMIGKLNCDAWAHGASGENSDFGVTRNPWDTSRVPGGSSSGPAAALSANFSLFTMGTDTGGSIRQPAGFCSVVGLKPTYGAVSRYGVVAMGSSLDVMGPFTRAVSDAKVIFETISGKDKRDSTLSEQTSTSRGKKMKIGIPKEYFVKGIEGRVEELVKGAAGVFEKNDVELVDISLPLTKYAISTYYIIQTAEVSSNLGRYDGIRFGNDRNSFGDEAIRRIMLGTHVLSAGYYDAYYAKAMKVRSKIIEDFEKAFSKVDAIIAPTSPTPPFKLGEKAEDPLKMYLADIFTASANLAGIPGLAMSAGFTKDKLPVGFQLMGPRFSENILFSLGELYQKHTKWHLEDPKL